MTSTPLRMAFMGSPDFAAVILAALLDAGHELAAVYCQPARPAGRGHRERRCAVHEFAEARGLEVRTPASLKDADEQAAFAALELDVAVVAAYGQILPKAVLDAPRLGCVNVHASLLPRWRGAAPVHRAIEAGDTETGVTIMQMDEGLDTGDMLLATAVPIDGHATGGALEATLAELGAKLIVEALDGLAEGTLDATPQPEDGVTLAPKLHRDEARLDWAEPAEVLERRVRAFDPWPGAWTERDDISGGERLKVLAVRVVGADGGPGTTPGTILDDQLTVACGEHALRLTRVQRAGKGAMTAADYLRGRPAPAGTVLK